MPKSKENMYATDTLMDERELVLRLIDGDEDAFCELYAAYKNRLLYFAMKFVKSREFAEDIFQDAFTGCMAKACVYQSGCVFSPIYIRLYAIVSLNQIRDMANEDKLKEHILSHAVDSANETNNKILFDDLKDVLSRALEQLTPRQREVFNMSRDLQMSHKEIAEALGVSVNTVQEHISVSLKVIRAYLTKYSGTSADILLILLCLNL